MSTLNNLPLGHTATVVAVGGEGSLRQHFLDMGIIPQVDVTMVKHAPMGDPVEVRVHGYELTLRLDDARRDRGGGRACRRRRPRRNAHAAPLRRAEAAAAPRPRRGRPVPRQGRRASAARGRARDVRARGQPELRQDHAVQPGSPDRASTWAISPASRWTARTGASAVMRRRRSRTCRASTPCRRTPARRWSRASFCWKGIRAASSTSWTPRTWSATCI